MEDFDENVFKTSDTQIAAYFVISGIKLVKIDISDFPAVFNFENPRDGTIAHLLDLWEDGITPMKAYINTYKRLTREAKKAIKLD